MMFSITPNGILSYIPILRTAGWTFADLYWSLRGSAERLLLVLAPHPFSPHPESRKSYNVGGNCRIITSAREDTKRQLRQMYPRLVLISALGDTSRGGKVLLNGVRARISWEEVYLVHHHASAESNQLLPSQRTIPVMPMNLTLATPFRFDELSIRKFEQESGAHLVSVTNTGLPWKGDPPATYIFRFSESEWPFLVIQVGQCQAEDQSEKSHRAEPASLWATVGWMSGRDSPISRMSNILASLSVS